MRTLSFWRMKAPASRFGEGAAHRLLADLHDAVSTERDVKFHLMGHSFGCIVVSAAIAGPATKAASFRVQSLALVQGAPAIWSYCSEIPYRRAGAGLLPPPDRRGASGRADRHNSGRSTMPPWAMVSIRRRGRRPDGVPAPGELPPKYAAAAPSGIQGPGVEVEFLPIVSPTWMAATGSRPARCYNLDGSDFIIGGGGFFGVPITKSTSPRWPMRSGRRPAA